MIRINRETHFLDDRRPKGRRDVGPNAQVIQLPVVCRLDVVEYANNQGTKDEDYATTDLQRVTCRDCRDRVMASRGRYPAKRGDGSLVYVSIPID